MKFSFHLIGHFSFMITMFILLIIGIMKAHQKKSNWVRNHKRFVLTGVGLGLAGFLIMFVSKLMGGYSHFISTHSKFGGMVLLLSIVTITLGALILKNRLKAKWVHRLSAVLTLLMWIMAAGLRVSMLLN